MLAQSSDWTFIMKTGTTVPYATKRINQHILQFNKIYDDLRANKLGTTAQRTSGWPTSRAGTISSRTSTTASTPAEPRLAAPKTAPRASVAAKGSVRRVRVRAVREDGRSGRRRGRAAQGAARARHRRARRDAALRGHAVERPRGARRLPRPCRCGGAARARACASASCRAATSRSTASSTTATSTAPTSTARPPKATRQPGTLHVPVARIAGAVQGAGLLSRRHPLQRLADGAGAGLRQHRRVDAAAARARRPSIRSTTSPTRAIFDGGGMFITGLGREHYNPRELEHFGAMNLTKARALSQHDAVDGQPDLRARDPDRRVRQRPGRRPVARATAIWSAS